MKKVPENELFSAYLDGELTAEEQAQMERLLATSSESRQLLESLRTLSATLQSLPAHKLDEDLSRSVLRLAERRVLSESPAELGGAAELPATRDALQPDDLAWRPSLRRLLRPRNLIFPAAAVAIAVLLVVTERDGMNRPGADRLALAPPAASEATMPARRAKETPERLVIGPAPQEGQPLAAKTLTADEKESLRFAGEPLAKGKRDAETPGLPVMSSTPVNVAPSLLREGRNADAALPESMTTNLAMPSPAASSGKHTLKGGPGMSAGSSYGPGASPARPLAMSVEEAKKADTDSLRPAKSPATGVASKKPAGEPSTEPSVRAEERSLAELAPVIVVRCEVNKPATARGVLQQVLAKQQIVLVAHARQDAAVGTALGGRGGADAGRFEVEVTPGQLQTALAELKTHRDVFAAWSLETPAARARLAKGGVAGDKDLKKQAVSGEDSYMAGKSPAETPGSATVQSLGAGAAMSPGFQGQPTSLGTSRSMGRSLVGGQSEVQLKSQLTQQVTPSEQFPTVTSQAGVGQAAAMPQQIRQAAPGDAVQREGSGQPVAETEKSVSGVAQARQRGGMSPASAGEKQRVVFVFRLVPAAAAAADAARSAPTAAAKAEAATKAKVPAAPAMGGAVPAASAPSAGKP